MTKITIRHYEMHPTIWSPNEGVVNYYAIIKTRIPNSRLIYLLEIFGMLCILSFKKTIYYRHRQFAKRLIFVRALVYYDAIKRGVGNVGPLCTVPPDLIIARTDSEPPFKCRLHQLGNFVSHQYSRTLIIHPENDNVSCNYHINEVCGPLSLTCTTRYSVCFTHLWCSAVSDFHVSW